MTGGARQRIGVALVALAAGGLVVAALYALPQGSADSDSSDSATLDRGAQIPGWDVAGMDRYLSGIEDPIVRQAVLWEWLRLNKGRQSPSDLMVLCERMSGKSHDLCIRRVGSPHLYVETR